VSDKGERILRDEDENRDEYARVRANTCDHVRVNTFAALRRRRNHPG
jgi:hypothetical protein